MKVIIVGGVAGGASAAARIRRLDEQAEILMFERSGHVSYANCGLPYYIGDVISDSDELTLQTPESFYARFRIDVRVRHEVIAIHPDKKTVSVKNLNTEEVFEETYDKLLLSPGAKPTVPPFHGIDKSRVFTLRTVEDTFRIKQFLQEHQPKSVVIAGGGFIGLEMAENLRHLGLDVTIVQQQPQVLTPLDEDMASFLHNSLRKHGIVLKLNATVKGFYAEGERIFTEIENDCPISSDMVLLAIGVTPDTALAKDANLTLGQKGAIVVNDRMETSVKDIYAVGDAVEIRHAVTNSKALISLAGPANKQGRIAADNITGGDSRYLGSLGSSILKLFDLTSASTGIGEKTAKQLGIAYDKVVLTPGNHAGYYPGSQQMMMKVLWEKESLRLLGAQIVGFDGVDKRIDVFATAIYNGMKATDLMELDLAYAPPYSSAKDPVNMAGFLIENVSNGLVKQYHWHDISLLKQDGCVQLIDTRTRKEYESGHIEGFINIPIDELREHISELDRKKSVYLLCQSGVRSYIASRILCNYGFDAYHLSGGYGFYSAIMEDKMLHASSYPCGMER